MTPARKPERGHSCWSIGLRCEFPRFTWDAVKRSPNFALAFPEPGSWWKCPRCGFVTRRPDLYEAVVGLPRVPRRYLDRRIA